MTYVRMCAPCAGLDATPQNIYAIKGRCEHCGDDARGDGVPLYRAPKRDLPGLEAR